MTHPPADDASRPRGGGDTLTTFPTCSRTVCDAMRMRALLAVRLTSGALADDTSGSRGRLGPPLRIHTLRSHRDQSPCGLSITPGTLRIFGRMGAKAVGQWLDTPGLQRTIIDGSSRAVGLIGVIREGELPRAFRQLPDRPRVGESPPLCPGRLRRWSDNPRLPRKSRGSDLSTLRLVVVGMSQSSRTRKAPMNPPHRG